MLFNFPYVLLTPLLNCNRTVIRMATTCQVATGTWICWILFFLHESLTVICSCILQFMSSRLSQSCSLPWLAHLKVKLTLSIFVINMFRFLALSRWCHFCLQSLGIKGPSSASERHDTHGCFDTVSVTSIWCAYDDDSENSCPTNYYSFWGKTV